MAFRINGGSYPALARALGIHGRTVLEVRPASTRLQYSTAGAGRLSFVNKPYVSYEGGTLSFSLSRNGGAAGTIAVDWSMTVTEGAPSPSNGTISWNNGEAGVKTVLVQAGIVAADRNGYIVLSNPRSLSGGAAPIIVGDDGQPVTGLYWPMQVPGYTSCYPGVAGFGMNTAGGSGRGFLDNGDPEPPMSVFFITDPSDANTGSAIGGHGSNAYSGTFEYFWRHAAWPKTGIQCCSGALSTGRTIPLQTGTPPRPGRVTYYGQFAPPPGFVIRNTNVSLNGASNVVLWHPYIDMGDVPSASLPAGARDCLSSGYNGGVVSKIVVINASLKRSIDEIGGFYDAHMEVTFVNCAFYEPLHDAVIDHPEDPPTEDHGFGLYLGGGAVAPNQSAGITHFRCLTGHVTGRGPMVSALTFSYVNNINYNNGRPTGINADGNSVQMLANGASAANHHNFIANGFLRGPNNRGNLVAISVTGTYPAGSSGYAFGNCQLGWTQPSNQAAYFTSTPVSYGVSTTIHADAYPDSWGQGFSGVLLWAANPQAPTAAEWHSYIDLFDRTVGATPLYRDARLQLVMTQMRNAVNGIVQTDQFVNTTGQSGGTPAVPVIVVDPLNPGIYWDEPVPTGVDRDVPYPPGSGTFLDGTPMAGLSRLEAWGYRRHLVVTRQAAHASAFTAPFIIQNDTTGPSTPTLGAPTSVTTTSMVIPATALGTDAHSGILDHALERAAGAGSTTFTQIDQGALIFPKVVTGLTPATRYRYRARARNRAGLYGTYSGIVETDTLSSGAFDNVGVLRSYAQLDLAANPVSSIDMSQADYNIFATQGNPVPVTNPNVGLPGSGSHTHIANGWPKGGGAYCQLTPPTSDGYERGIFLGNLWRNRTVQIQELTYRIEWRASNNFFAYSGNGSKFAIVHSRRTFTDGSPDDRPVIFLQKVNQHGGQFDRANTCVFGPAGETVAGYGTTVYGDTLRSAGGTLDYYLTSAWPYYMVNAGDAGSFQGGAMIQAGEVITIEHRMITIAMPGYPRGLLAIRIYRENGTFFERGIPWNWDTNVPLGAFLYEVQQTGMGQWNSVPGANAQWTNVGGIITIARNLSTLVPATGGWLGRRLT